MVNVTKSIDKNTSINASYLVDAISSASMKMTLKVDGITSATPNKQGGGDNTPDELRHQLSLGVTRNISDVTFSALGMYSIEHDYSSKTFATNLSIPFAKKNTVLLLGYAGNWDKIFPQTRYWTRNRNTTTINLGLSQILSKSIIAQADFSFINIDGYMLDGYQVVRIINGPTFMNLEPVEPDRWVRKAAGLRTNIAVSKLSSIGLGYRYYWDTWDIRSHTIETSYKTHLGDYVNLALSLRQYFQTKAYFFEPNYTEIEPFMAVDSKLNSGYTNDLSIGFTVKGNKNINFPIIDNNKVTFMASFGVYHRHTDSIDWIMRMSDLYAILINLGFKISI
jgi:outer membrane usher protein FimD/PapC